MLYQLHTSYLNVPALSSIVGAAVQVRFSFGLIGEGLSRTFIFLGPMISSSMVGACGRCQSHLPSMLSL